MSIDLHDNDFDDFIKNKYEGHTSSPPEEYWNDIENRLNTNQRVRIKRHLVSYWLSAAAAAILISVSVYYVSIHKTDSRIQSSDANNKTQSIAKHTESRIQSPDANNKTQSIAKKTDKYTGKHKSVNTNIKNKPKDVFTFNTNKKAHSAAKSTKANPVKSVSSYIDSGNLASNKTSKESNMTLKSSEQENYTTRMPTGNDTSLLKLAANAEIKSLPANAIVLPESQDYIQKPENILLNNPLPDKIKETPVQVHQSKSSLRDRLSFEVFFTPYYSYRMVTDNSTFYNPEYNKVYFNKRDKGGFTYAAGMFMDVKANDKISVGTGVTYSQYTQGFQTESFHLNYTDSHNAWLYTSTGNLYFKIVSTDSISQNDILHSSVRFSFINIPLTFKYRFTRNYFVDAGVSLNLLVKQSLNMQAENFNGEFDATPISGLERINCILNFGFGREISLLNKFSLIINPGINLYLTSINKDATVKSYPFSIGLQVGLKYNL